MFQTMTRLSLIVLLCLLAIPLSPTSAQEPRGDRILVLDVSEAAGEEYDAALAIALDMGIDQVGLSFDWADIETAPGVYDSTWLDIINIFYPAYDLKVDFTIRPIHTGTLRVPDDLRNTRLDDPEMIERFSALLDFLFETMPDVEFSSLVIGSEFDAYLGNNASMWAQYTRLASQGADYARQLKPGVPIAFEAMLDGFRGESAVYLRELNAHADIVGVSFYPLGSNFAVQDPAVIHDVFAELAAAYPDKPIYFYQFGYPSSEKLNSSEEKQAEFIQVAFDVWDDYTDHVVMIDFTWLTDMSADEVAFFEQYYSFSSAEFAAFLGTLGLRYADGTEKLALQSLRDEVAQRGW